MRFSIFQLIYLTVTVPLGILITRIKEIKTGKRIPSLYTDIEVSLKQNNNKMYYVVEKYTNNEKLTQYVNLYLPMHNTFKNVTIDVADYLRVTDRTKRISLKKGRTYGTLKFQDFDIINFSNMLNNKIGKTISLVRIDQEVVNC